MKTLLDSAKILLTLVAAMLSLPINSQTYDQLWKEVQAANGKDLPKTEIEVLGKIVAKATVAGDYGQLLAASLQKESRQVEISPDSLKPVVNRLSVEASRCSSENPALAAVYYTVLSKIYNNNDELGIDHIDKAQKYKSLALRDKDVLASTLVKDYAPLVSQGKDSHIFGDDLLHVIGIENDAWKELHDWYAAQYNREAACVSAMHLADRSNVAQIDSLIDEYADLDVCGDLAVMRFDNMSNNNNEERCERYAYGEKALELWKNTNATNKLRNRLAQMTVPQIRLNAGEQLMMPGEKRKIRFTDIRNITQIRLTVTRTSLGGDCDMDVDNDWKKIVPKLQHDTKKTYIRNISGFLEYEMTTDSIQLDSMANGVYVLELTTDKKDVKPIRFMLYVSNLFLIHEKLPANNYRFVVVDAKNGMPVQGAKIRLTSRERYGAQKEVQTVITDRHGEVIVATKANKVYCSTDADKAYPEMDFWDSYSQNEVQRTAGHVRIFTDRSIYRPGQKVHAAIIGWAVDDLTTRAIDGKQLEIVLRDANYKDVSKKTVTLDTYGTAATDFDIPSSGLTGTYSLYTSFGSGTTTNVEVSEYKRPTFEVDIPDVKERYSANDTLIVKGIAKMYSGVPVGGAKVTYRVIRRQALWWFRWFHADGEWDVEVSSGKAVTDDQGEFTMRVPLAVENAKNKLFYNFEVQATVTDAAGESHDGSVMLPLGTRETVLIGNLPDKILADSLTTVTYSYRNAAGQEIQGSVSFTIDGGNTRTVDANKPFTIDKLPSGRHVFEAVCGTDTLRQEVAVFTLKDKHPVIETRDWFYQSAETFPRDGSPIYIQVGSSDPEQHIVYTIFSGDRVIENGVIDQKAALTTQKFSYKKDYGTGLLITYAWVHDGKKYIHRAALHRPLPDKRLKLTWHTFRDRLAPGQNEEWMLTIKRPEGKPADAQLMATLYDKSLDQIESHSWGLSLGFNQYLPYANWNAHEFGDIFLYEDGTYKSLPVHDLEFSHMDDDYYRSLFYGSHIMIRGRGFRNVQVLTAKIAGVPVIKKDNEVKEESKVFDVVEQMPQAAGSIPEGKRDLPKIEMRENMRETAFFYPQLQTDSEGNATLKFTLPESLTTWRFMGLAHDSDMNYGLIESEIIAQKTVMVQPNLPRFLRNGDKAVVSTRISNTGDKTVVGEAKLEIIDPMTEKILFTTRKQYSIAPQTTSLLSFSIMDMDAKDCSLAIVRVSAMGDGYSDGEQHYMPILANKELVINTYPFTQNEKGSLDIPLAKVGPENRTIQYTNNPAWLMIQALPYVGTSNDNNAISLASALYANVLSHAMLTSSPVYKTVIEQWKRETGSATPLMSDLEKDEELKLMVLNETPWVAAAESENEQKASLIRYFDENNLNNSIASLHAKLQKLRNPDGSYSWFPGMEGSFYMTVAVTKIMTRLSKQLNKPASSYVTDKTWSYLDKKVTQRVAYMKEWERKGEKVFPSDALCDYVYTNALVGRRASADINYIVALLEKQPRDLTIYGKANSAVILAQYNKERVAKEYLKSIEEYTVYKEEMGRYFDTDRAQYSWFDYKIPTQSAVIEAYRLLAPEDTKTITELQRWLLQEKRTQSWNTPLNSVNAIYAFMNGNIHTVIRDSIGGHATFIADGKELMQPQATAGTGYVKMQIPSSANTLTINKTSDGTSWGALYARFYQDVKDIDDAHNGISITREVIGSGMKVGAKVKVRITVTADRDYDFVQVSDKRAACLEPVEQLSGYAGGYYYEPKDCVTNYFFSWMPKGEHIIETEYYIDRVGEYQSGTCTAQCAYAPAYTGRAKAGVLKVEN